MSAAGYAVVDVETTGLLPDRHHRIAEVAVVHVDLGGTPTGDWASLVNPGRDLGPQHVHRILAADARRAPTFAELAGDLAEQLRDRVLVAHNLRFDSLFLTTEFTRVGAPLALDGLCTMRLAQRYLDSPSRSLAACCRVVGVPQHDAHTALDDARAAAGLLVHLLRAAGTPAPWRPLLADRQHRPWPPLLAPGRRTTQRRVSGPPHFLSRLVDRLPGVSEPPQADDYLVLLDRALVGRHLSETDQDALVSTAAQLGLDRDAVGGLHRGYLAALRTAAAELGPVGAAELADLAQVAALFGVPTRAVPVPRVTVPPTRFRLAVGDVVVFTGDMQDRREPLERRAAAAGLTVHERRVTRQTRLLIAADLDTLSRKAATARDYGVPIVTESAFGSLLATLEGRA